MSEPVRSIIIQLKGDVTYATMLSGYDGELVARHACARRNPKDEYNRYEGARIALARVLGVDPFPEQKDGHIVNDYMNVKGTFCKAPEKPKKDPNVFKVGDRVRIRANGNFERMFWDKPGVVTNRTLLPFIDDEAILTIKIHDGISGFYLFCPAHIGGRYIEHWDDETMGVNPFTNKKEARKK